MEENRQQNSFTNISTANHQQDHHTSADPDEWETAPLPFSIILVSLKETKTQIFKYKDRSKWLSFNLKKLTASNLQDKELVEHYLRHLYRHMCKAPTVERAYNTIHSFLRPAH